MLGDSNEYPQHMFLAHLNLKAHWWAYSIAMVRHPSVVRPPFSKIFFSKTTGPIKAKFHVEPQWDGGVKVCSWQMTRVTKDLCLYKNSDPKGLSTPALGLYTRIKTWKIMYKIRLQRYFLETCNKWAKWQGFSVDIRILSTKGCLPLPRGYIHVEKH